MKIHSARGITGKTYCGVKIGAKTKLVMPPGPPSCSQCWKAICGK